MSLIDLNETPEAKVDILAKGFQKEANQAFKDILLKAEDAVQRFWFRNRDSDGNPSAVAEGDNPEPTGPEMLNAMGTNAQKVIVAAHERVKLVVGVATALGKMDLIDQSKFDVPYDLVWGEDGSLISATLK